MLEDWLDGSLRVLLRAAAAQEKHVKRTASCLEVRAKRLAPRFAAAGGLGLLHRAEPAGALADLHPDLRVPAARRRVIDALAGGIHIALDGAVGRGRDGT